MLLKSTHDDRPVFTIIRRPLEQLPVLRPASDKRRSKIWELSPTLHCSIVGTCLKASELRALVGEHGVADAKRINDHELHRLAVSAVENREPLSRRINKALDDRHRVAITRFAKADTAEMLRQAWDEAMRSGDIPGGYWALLTHPRTTEALVRHAFGDVHMLSHLVGAANRADIQRLRSLEDENARLRDKLARQQRRLRDDIVEREVRIRELGTALEQSLQQLHAAAQPIAPSPAVDHLLVDLRKQLDVETRRRERAENKARELSEQKTAAERSQTAGQRELDLLRNELTAAEDALTALSMGDTERTEERLNLCGRTVLYVGGRPHQVAHFRSLLAKASGTLIHHDGGLEQSNDLLPGLVSRADVAVFPVDSISHDAALSVKRICLQAGKRFVALRTSGLGSLLNGLKTAC